MARDTTAPERTLSGALIAAAFSFVGLAIFASAAFVDKTTHQAFMIGNGLVSAAVLSLVTSIIFGGKSFNRITPGPLNGFALQALFGLLGVGLLLAASAVFAFNPRRSETSPDLSNLALRLGAAEQRIKALEMEAATARPRIERSAKSTVSAGVTSPAPAAAPTTR